MMTNYNYSRNFPNPLDYDFIIDEVNAQSVWYDIYLFLGDSFWGK